MTSTFAPDSTAGKTLAQWWQALSTGERAELRRARSPDEAALVPATIDLITRLHGSEAADHTDWKARMPAIAGLAAHLDAKSTHGVLDDRTSLPERMATLRGDRVLVSPLRFRRLLRTPRDELYRPMIRILALLDRQANLYDLAESLFWWGPRKQKDWAFIYFPKLPKSA